MATLAGRNLPAKARALGMHVIEWDGWEGKSEGSFDALGVLLHHDGMALGYVDDNEANNLNVVKNMSQPGALGSQLWIGLDTEGRMTLVFMKAGRASHAGNGSGFRAIPANMGNPLLVGIETDHTTGTGWPDEMIRYIDLTTILLCDEFDIDPDRWLAGHREYAPDRKPDPESFDLEAWRGRVKRREPWGGAAAGDWWARWWAA